MELNKEYEEKVYSGVIGKIIGVYLGRPFEGWWYDRIIEELEDIKERSEAYTPVPGGVGPMTINTLILQT